MFGTLSYVNLHRYGEKKTMKVQLNVTNGWPYLNVVHTIKRQFLWLFEGWIGDIVKVTFGATDLWCVRNCQNTRYQFITYFSLNPASKKLVSMMWTCIYSCRCCIFHPWSLRYISHIFLQIILRDAKSGGHRSLLKAQKGPSECLHLLHC